MPIVYYEYEKSMIVEDSVDVPQRVIDKGEAAIRSYVTETVEMEEYAAGCESEDVRVSFKIAEAA